MAQEKTFNSYEEAQEYAKNLGKTQFEIVLIDGVKVLLAGTPMAEDAFDNAIAECVSKSFSAIGVDIPQEDIFCDNDTINPIKDCITEAFRAYSDIQLTIYGEEEY